MITLLVLFLICSILGGLMSFLFKLTWGMFKLVFGVLLIPALIIALVVLGIKYIMLPALVIVAIVWVAKAIMNKAGIC